MNLCQILGHKITYPLAPGDYRIAYCERWGESRQENRDEHPWNLRDYYGWLTPTKLVQWWVRDQASFVHRRTASFLKPCSDCGKRFGLHDSAVDHVPF